MGADELVEHVDAAGAVIGIVARERMRAERLRHRTVGVIVLAGDGRLLVHRRADTKDYLPGWWDICVGGVVGAGEAAEAAAVRELAEEIGVTVGIGELVGLGEVEYTDAYGIEYSHLYQVVADGPYVFADGEVAEARLVDPLELAALLAAERFLPSSVALLHAHLPAFFPASTLGVVHRVEFTIEPFEEGHPGPHVMLPTEALRAHGFEVEFGPFGSACLVPAGELRAAVALVVGTAFEHGATHVNVDIGALAPPAGEAT